MNQLSVDGDHISARDNMFQGAPGMVAFIKSEGAASLGLGTDALSGGVLTANGSANGSGGGGSNL